MLIITSCLPSPTPKFPELEFFRTNILDSTHEALNILNFAIIITDHYSVAVVVSSLASSSGTGFSCVPSREAREAFASSALLLSSVRAVVATSEVSSSIPRAKAPSCTAASSLALALSSSILSALSSSEIAASSSVISWLLVAPSPYSSELSDGSSPVSQSAEGNSTVLFILSSS